MDDYIFYEQDLNDNYLDKAKNNSQVITELNRYAIITNSSSERTLIEIFECIEKYLKHLYCIHKNEIYKYDYKLLHTHDIESLFKKVKNFINYNTGLLYEHIIIIKNFYFLKYPATKNNSIKISVTYNQFKDLKNVCYNIANLSNDNLIKPINFF